MEDSTPIFALKTDEPNIRKQPLEVMSYSDVLRSMEPAANNATVAAPAVVPSPVQQPPQQPQRAQPQMDYYSAAPPPQSAENPAEPKTADKNKPDFKQFQNEMLILLMSYIVVHMSTVQAWIATKIPNIVADNGSMSVLGLITNGVLLIVLWNVAKRLVLKYMQEPFDF